MGLSDLLADILGSGSPESIGKAGESMIAGKLGWVNFFGRKGKLLKNIYLPSDTTGSTEIDLLYITQKGIIVIESKNYSGYIFGNESQLNWTATLYAGKDFLGRKKTEKHPFYNPIRQNNNHMKYLAKYLRQEIPMISLIVFSDHCELKNIACNAPNVYICKRNDLSSIMRHIWKEHADILTADQIEDICAQLLPLTNVDAKEKQQHVQNIHERFNDPRKCPLCGGDLVGRTTKSGPHAGRRFWGCSNYPQCRFMKKM